MYLQDVSQVPSRLMLTGSLLLNCTDVVCCYAEGASETASTQISNSQVDESFATSSPPKAVRPSELPRHAAQLSLAEARALLDKDHYGLDKVFT